MTAPHDNAAAAVVVEDFLQLVAKPEDAAVQLLYERTSQHQQRAELLCSQLRTMAATLFRNIERMAETEPLSGLEELYLGKTTTTTTAEPNDAVVVGVDAETLWGQVELQNTALHKKLKRSVKQLCKAAASRNAVTAIQLLEQTMSDDDGSARSSGPSEKASSDEHESEEDDDEDEETKRIRKRMERAEEDMEDEEEDSSTDEDGERDASSSSKRVELEIEEGEEFEKDRDAANLHDGFFNLQEMEAFADEEEEYLPQDAFGEVRPEKSNENDKRSFHQKQRDGDFEGDSDGDDSDDEDKTTSEGLGFRNESSVRRRRYREDDEVEALHNLYEDGNEEEDDSENDVINMTAADLFGKPSDRYYKRWHSKKGQRKDGEDDSWNDYDFDQAASDNKMVGWNDDYDDPENSEHGEPSSDDDENQEDDEIIDMKLTSTKGSTKSQNPPTKQAEKIMAATEQLEKEMLAEKPWQMTGETGSSSRPVNSLLELTPQFEVASKLAPIITVEHTANIEELIKKRILAEDWDDVVPRELPDVGWHKKRGELPEVSQEKSKLGLGELYEREYLKKAVGYDKDADEKETDEEKAKNEMKSLFANLCSKLDALSNYHFAPRPVADEAEVRTVTLPAIAMEEVLPLHVSDARAVAPEEVYGAKRGRDAVLRADSELEQQERKRLRNSKKAARRKSRQAKLADDKLISRLQPGLGLNNPYEKRKAREELSMARAGGKLSTGASDVNNDYTTSSTFFKRMQQDAEQSIQNQKGPIGEKGASVAGKRSSEYKL